MFLSGEEQALTEEYLRQGYIIRSVADQKALTWIRKKFMSLSTQELKVEDELSAENWLNQVHEYVPVEELNDFRMKMIVGINAEPEFREQYFNLARPYLNTLVGNELSMQLRINLSIQFPGDESSLLPVHADTWSGDSPFEVVVWTPLVDCFGSKSMYILSPQKNKKIEKTFALQTGDSSNDLYQSICDDVKWLEVKYGEVVIFNQALPHGNRVNAENETRWSMNCRFKSVFTPYGDKKLGEFFEPVTLRAASKAGMEYKLPEIL
jgi:sporadic carbohydrate cluster 2OG-Fe(II) oxygenase